jgi:hypothetical protein
MDLTLYCLAFIMLLVGVKVACGDYSGDAKLGVGLLTGIGAIGFAMLGLAYHVK